MFRTVHLKVRITRCYGILVYEHAMKSIDHCQKENICQIIDLVFPDDGRVRAKEDEKVEKYQDLAREIRKMWGVMTKVMPIVVGDWEQFH